MSAQGQCLCGSVKFAIDFPSKWMAHCHCTMCQRSHGAAFVTWVGVEESQVSVEDSKCSLMWYSSSQSAERAFCSHCGSSLFFRSDNRRGELDIVRACFTSPLDRNPDTHVYYNTHADWFEVKDDVIKKSEPEVVE